MFPGHGCKSDKTQFKISFTVPLNLVFFKYLFLSNSTWCVDHKHCISVSQAASSIGPVPALAYSPRPPAPCMPSWGCCFRRCRCPETPHRPGVDRER